LTTEKFEQNGDLAFEKGKIFEGISLLRTKIQTVSVGLRIDSPLLLMHISYNMY